MGVFDMPGVTAAMSLMQQKMAEPTNWWEAAKALPKAAMQASLGADFGGGLYDYFSYAGKNASFGPNGLGFPQTPKRRAPSPMLQAQPMPPIVFGGTR